VVKIVVVLQQIIEHMSIVYIRTGQGRPTGGHFYRSRKKLNFVEFSVFRFEMANSD